MQLPDRNFVLSNKARSYFWKGEGLFSIKHFPAGEAYYNVGRGTYKVCDPNYLLLNHQQEYTVMIDSPKPVESFTLFFKTDLIRSIYGSLSSSTERGLEGFDGATQPEFHLTNYAFNRNFCKQFHSFRVSYTQNKHNTFWLDEKLAMLAEHVLLAHLKNLQRVDTLSSLKRSTREEIFRRLLVAKEYMYANLEQDIGLDDLSRVSLLSVNHLLRHFKTLFGTTPHHCLTQMRIEKSKYLLKNTDYTVAQIVLLIGFSSIPSFCALFHRLEGITPMRYRLGSKKCR